jgi:predicted Zn-dependent protease
MNGQLLDTARWIMLATLLAAMGCGGGNGGGRVEFAEQGVSLELPPGWKRDPKSKHLLIERGKGEDSIGTVERSPLEGKSLDAYVDEMLRTGGRVQSRTSLKISGCDAVEVVSHAAYSLAEVFIKKDDSVIRVSFSVLPDDFKRQEQAFRKAFQSITVK